MKGRPIFSTILPTGIALVDVIPFCNFRFYIK